MHKVPCQARKCVFLLFNLWSCLCSNIDPEQFAPSKPVSDSHYIISSSCQALSCWLWLLQVCNVCASVPQPPPRMPVQYAEQRESDEEKQFRKVFQQLAGDVSATCTSLWTSGILCSNHTISLTTRDPRLSIVLHHRVVCLYCFLMFTLLNIYHIGHGSEPNWADEHPK